MKTLGTSLALSGLLLTSGIALAQSGEITGRVTDVFADRFVMEAQGQRLLVTPADGVTMPAADSTVAVTGTREGLELRAEAITAPGTSAAAPAPVATDGDLPEDLRGLSLADIHDRRNDDDERRISARLSDGTELRIEYRRDGTLDEVETDHAGAIPAELLKRILPPDLIAAREYAEMARVIEVEFDDGEVQIDGLASDGAQIELTAGSDGRIFSYEREIDRDARRAMTEDAARDRLTAMGYTAAEGGEENDGLRIFTATNPYGERVAVRLDEQGRVTREETVR